MKINDYLSVNKGFFSYLRCKDFRHQEIEPLAGSGVDAKVGIETGSMTPWLVHGLRSAGLNVECLDARRVKAALQMRLNKTDENDAEGLAQVMRTGWYRAVYVKSLDAHRARALLGARAQRNCREFRAGLGMIGAKEPDDAATQRTSYS